MNKYRIIFGLSLLFLVYSCKKDTIKTQDKIDKKTTWVDSIYNNMSLQEKVGQLFMVAAYSNRDSLHTNTIKTRIVKNHIGGIVFFQGGAVRQAVLTNKYQSISKVPLMIAIDAEWGLNMRLDSTFRTPYNMTLGAIQNDTIIKRIGKQIGKHCKRMGIHVNFAPVVDINTNPKNPIIGVRSYGEDKHNVTKKSIAFIEGMQAEGVMACVKHFPGHGDTATDSHKTLPTIYFSKKRIDSVELYPFKKVFNKGVASVMVAHLNVPSLEPIDGLPSSLSHTIVSKLLKEQLGFKGLIFTDALNMKGVSNYNQPGDIDLAAFKAGNDVLLFSEDPPKAIALIIEDFNKNEISEERLSHSVKKILAAKYSANLHEYKPIEISNLVADLNTIDNEILYSDAISNAITLLKNDNFNIPLKENTKSKVAYIKFGDGNNTAFLSALREQTKVEVLQGSKLESVLKELKKFDRVIIGYHQSNSRKTAAISTKNALWIEKIAENNTVILNVFSSLYCVANLSFKDFGTVIIAYENSEISQKITAQIIFGKKKALGILPASINSEFLVNYGMGNN